ncbi:MAG: hypothetical protein ACI9XK_004158 [Granulosicoccus sp.]|jgi:hypothetical protein
MSKPQLTLHYREGCHLCEDMEQQLYELLEPDSFSLIRIDIDSDPVLRVAYNIRVPVLSCDQLDVCEHFLDLHALKEALAGYNTASPSES